MSVCPKPGCPNLEPCPRHGLVLCVVSGPPCAGKTTYILEHMDDHDVVIDLDRLALAISPKSASHVYPEYVRECARFLLIAVRDHLREAPPACKVWLVETALRDHRRALARHRAFGATVVELDPGIDVCLERARRERPPEVADLIREWYAEAAR